MTADLNQDEVDTADSLADCPASYGTDDSCMNPDYIKPSFGLLPVPFSLISCTMSVIGSFLIVLSYLLWKDIRTWSRKIITYLAIADFFTASGYIMASINFLVYESHKKYNPVGACQLFECACQIQAYISSWATYSAFWWTCILAMYFYATIVKGNSGKINQLFPLYHILAWGSPILAMFPLLLTGSLGYSLFAAGGWCFIKNDRQTGHTSFTDFSSSFITVIKILAGGKAMEIFTYVWVIVFYLLIQVDIKKKQKSRKDLYFTGATLLKKVETKLAIIPVAFIFFRMWGTLQFFFSIIVFQLSAIDSTGCVPYGVYIIFEIFAVLQAIGDGAQGWVNAGLYVVLSPRIRERMFLLPIKYICKKIMNTPDEQCTTLHSATVSHKRVNEDSTNEELDDPLTPSESSVSDLLTPSEQSTDKEFS